MVFNVHEARNIILSFSKKLNEKILSPPSHVAMDLNKNKSKKRKQLGSEDGVSKQEQLPGASKKPTTFRDRTNQTGYELVRAIQESFAAVSKDGTWERGRVWQLDHMNDWHSVWVQCNISANTTAAKKRKSIDDTVNKPLCIIRTSFEADKKI